MRNFFCPQPTSLSNRLILLVIDFFFVWGKVVEPAVIFFCALIVVVQRLTCGEVVCCEWKEVDNIEPKQGRKEGRKEIRKRRKRTRRSKTKNWSRGGRDRWWAAGGCPTWRYGNCNFEQVLGPSPDLIFFVYIANVAVFLPVISSVFFRW